MGFNFDGTRFLLYARTQGVRFERTATVGRPELHLSAEALRKNLSDFGYVMSGGEVDEMMRKAGGFAEPFLEALGAGEVCSFDASGFEGASHIHDFNLPVGEGFKNRFTAVIDGGTLEHVFNFPVAIKNCMEMLEVGGHFLGMTPANNFPGHGLYQFSPELFFRVFSEPNGFRVVRMIVFEGSPGGDWFEVADPAAVGERVSFVNSQQATLLVIAQKVRTAQIFAAPPQQSDYAALWSPDGASAKVDATHAPLDGRRADESFFPRAARTLYGFAPAPFKSLYRRVRGTRRNEPFSNSRYFRRMRIP